MGEGEVMDRRCFIRAGLFSAGVLSIGGHAAASLMAIASPDAVPPDDCSTENIWRCRDRAWRKHWQGDAGETVWTHPQGTAYVI